MAGANNSRQNEIKSPADELALARHSRIHQFTSKMNDSNSPNLSRASTKEQDAAPHLPVRLLGTPAAQPRPRSSYHDNNVQTACYPARVSNLAGIVNGRCPSQTRQ